MVSPQKNNHNHKLFLYAVVMEELDPTKPVKEELLRIKDKLGKALNSDRIMLQDIS